MTLYDFLSDYHLNGHLRRVLHLRTNFNLLKIIPFDYLKKYFHSLLLLASSTLNLSIILSFAQSKPYVTL